MFDIIGKRNWFFALSLLITIPGLFFILLTPITGGKEGLKFSIDYTGGTKWTIKFADSSVTSDQVRTELANLGQPDASVVVTGSGFFEIKLSKLDLRQEAASATPVPTLAPSGAASGASASPSAAGTASPSVPPSALASGSGSPAASASAIASAGAGAAASGSANGSPSASAGAAASPSAATASASASPGAASPPPSGSAVASGSAGASAAPTAIPGGNTQIPREGEMGAIVTGLEATLGPIESQASLTSIGAIVSADLINQAVILILVGSAGILGWITFRFRDVKFGVTALIALLHDVIVVVGIFAILGTLFGVEIDALFVTAMLTVIGFSVHDTIVVFDRIRENRARHVGEPFAEVVNHSVLQTFGRSITTSFTVVLTLLALLLFGGSATAEFVLALLIGIISGTYSSIFNASPLLVVWQEREDRKRGRPTLGRPATGVAS